MNARGPVKCDTNEIPAAKVKNVTGTNIEINEIEPLSFYEYDNSCHCNKRHIETQQLGCVCQEPGCFFFSRCTLVSAYIIRCSNTGARTMLVTQLIRQSYDIFYCSLKFMWVILQSVQIIALYRVKNNSSF